MKKTLYSALSEEMDMPAPNGYDMQMYIMTNRLGINGAASLMYDHAMEEASKVIGGDYVVLPSSIHEVILLRDDGNRNYDDLKQMVREINQATVKQDEQLGDSVYHYDAKTNTFETADAYTIRMSQEQNHQSQSFHSSQKINTQKTEVTAHTFRMKL